MARFSRIHVINVLYQTGLVPLFYHPDIEICKQVVEAIYKGGARVLEFTNRGDYAHEVFSKLNKYCASEFPDLVVGVGSIVDAATASYYMQMGANFIVSAAFREDISKVANRRKVPYMPGCGTLTEISKAEESGCEIVKLFPGSVYGPKFIKSIRAPHPWTSIMPTGGVSPDKDNLKSWFEAGAFCVGMGSKLIVKQDDGSFDLPRITELTKSSLAIIQELKK